MDELNASRCTGCGQETDGDLVPWSGERLCWPCTDLQLDLLAIAMSDQIGITVGRGVTTPGHVQTLEIDFDLLGDGHPASESRWNDGADYLSEGLAEDEIREARP